MNSDLLNLKENKNHGDFNILLSTYKGEITDSLPHVVLHWHKEIEMTLILRGKAEYKIDFTTYQVKEGDIVIISPESLHAINKISGYQMEWTTIIFSLDLLKSHLTDGCSLNYISPLLNKSYKLPVIINAESSGYEKIYSIIKNIIFTYDKKDIAYELELKSMLFSLFANLYKYNYVHKENTRNELTDDIQNKMKTVLNYVQENYNRDMSIEEIAKLCNFSEYHFMRFFKKYAGTSCLKYINNYRLEKSAELLKSTSSSITDISLECGFNNLSYFNKLFKRKYHLTPREFRDNI